MQHFKDSWKTIEKNTKKGTFCEGKCKKNEKDGSKTKVNRRTEERRSQLELIRNK
jgi:hypothetical protein